MYMSLLIVEMIRGFLNFAVLLAKMISLGFGDVRGGD